MRLVRIAIRLIAALGMLAILISPTSAVGAEMALPKPQIKVTPQAGSNQVIFLVTGVGFAPPAVTGKLYLQVVQQSTGETLEFNDPAEAELIASADGLIINAISFGGGLPDGAYQARVASAITGGTVYATYDMKLDNTLPVAPAISITPTSGPKGDPDGGGTLFLLAGTGMEPGKTYYLAIASADGFEVVNFSDPSVDADDAGIVLSTLVFGDDLSVGDYVAGLFTGYNPADQSFTGLVAKTNFTITFPAAPPVTTKPEIKVTPQAGPHDVIFLLTGVGFGPPNISGRIYFQVQNKATEQYVNVPDPVVSPSLDGLVALTLRAGSALANGTYVAKVASAPTGGTVYASYEMKLDSTLPVAPAISITPSFGPSGDPGAGGTAFILAGTSLTPNAIYTLEVVSADGRTTLKFDDPTVQADEEGIVLQVLTFDTSLPNGGYIARLRNAAGAAVAQTTFGLGTSAPSPQPSPTPVPSGNPSPSPSGIPSPPPTGNGGFLPGLPNTGGGGAATAAPASPDLGLAAGGLVIVTVVGIGSAIRRRRAA